MIVALATLHAQAPQPPDTILVNGHVITVDQQFSIAQAVAIAGGKFTAVGTNADVRKLVAANTQTIDLHGATVIPGLADDHLHDAGGGPGVDLSVARSLADVLAAIGARVKSSRPGDIIVSNSDWHEAQLKEHRLPYRRDLDAVSPDNPVVLVRGGHEYILNSAALAKWTITKDTAQPSGGRITRDAHGELNGELIDRAKSLVHLPPPPPLSIDELVAQHRKLNAAGLTSIRYPGASVEQYHLLQQMEQRGLLT
ncbi:MAG: amidohydrolase family protein, partial [Acidobacteria bacterium]|nr:amidohydrolase family protein [Acidobacteriota bacterium]